MADRAVRGLGKIRGAASSARVLDLLSVGLSCGGNPDYRARPFFKNAILNNAIIVKHRLRADEMGLFQPRRFVATKIILPIDRGDLSFGGRSIFVGQLHYDKLMLDCFGQDVGAGSKDRVTLEALDELPSLDPFILREHLGRRGIRPAACYFDVNEADLERMSTFVLVDIAPLVNLCFGAAGDYAVETKRLVAKLLSNTLDSDLEPLRETLKLDPHQYVEGVFCWKGFLYYKSLVGELFPNALIVAKEIHAMRAVGRLSAEELMQIRETKERLGRDILNVCNEIRRALNIYDRAFKELTSDSNPTAFRDFLLASPEMFFDLGVNFAAIQHIVSFWRYRVPKGRAPVMNAIELFDMLLDFESGIPRDTGVWRADTTLEAPPILISGPTPPQEIDAGPANSIML